MKSTLEANDEICFWPNEVTPADYSTFRVWTEDRTKRNIDELPISEIINAMKFILKQQFSLPSEDLIRETAKEFGFARTGTMVKNRIGFAVQTLISNGMGIEENGRIKLLTL